MDKKLKIDMSPKAVTARLRQVEALRQVCLSLARSSAGLEVIRKNPNNKQVQRTARAIGRPIQ